MSPCSDNVNVDVNVCNLCIFCVNCSWLNISMTNWFFLSILYDSTVQFRELYSSQEENQFYFSSQYHRCADDLVVQGARSSAGTILSQIPWNVLFLQDFM